MGNNNAHRKGKRNSAKVIPFKRKKNYKPLLVTILFAMLIIYIALFTPIFNITNIEVEGNERLDNNKIINLSGLPMGDNIFKVRYFEVKDNILKNQYINSVKISRHYPGTVKILVEERKPAAYLEYLSTFLIIDKEGIVLDVLKSIDDLKIPQIDGIKCENYSLGKKLVVNNEDVNKFNVALECINAGINYNISNIINKIDVDNIDAIVGYTYGDKYTINFIDSSQIEYKYKFLSQILKFEQENNVKYVVDFTSASRPVVKPKY